MAFSLPNDHSDKASYIQGHPSLLDSQSLGAFSYALLFAWFLLLVCSPLLFDTFFSGLNGLELRILFFLSMLAVLAFCKLLLKLCTNHPAILKGVAVAALLFFVGAACLPLTGFPFSLFACWACLGACTALGFLLWDYYAVACGCYKLSSYSLIGKATALGGLIVLVITCMQEQYACIATLCLFPASIVLIFLFLFSTPCTKNIYSQTYLKEVDVKKPFKNELAPQAMLYVLGYSLMFGYLLTCTNRIGASSELLSFLTAFVVLIAGMLVVLLNISDRIVRFCGELVRYFLPSGALLLLVFSSFFKDIPGIRIVVFVLLMFVLISYAITRTAYVIKLERPECFASKSSFLAARIVASMGFILGLLVSIVAVDQIENEAIGTVLLALVFILIAVNGVGKYAFSLQRDHLEKLAFSKGEANDKAADIAASVQNLYHTTCIRFAEHYALTSREADILYHLGKGRNARFMQEKLSISEHTAKSHIYNIYQKVGIHSQQELMSMLDKWYSDEKSD